MRRSETRFSRAQVLVHAAFRCAGVLRYRLSRLPLVRPISPNFWSAGLFLAGPHGRWAMLPVPLALGVLSPAFRRDASRLNRMSSQDWPGSAPRIVAAAVFPVSRFNAGQKLNAAFTVGALLVLFGTGLVMGSVLASWPTDYRTGATWVHDWTAFGLTIAVVGHVYFALKYRTGDTSASVAEPDNSRAFN